MTVTPGILESDWTEIARKATLFANKSTAELVQIDVCDGVFVGSTTWPYSAGAVNAEVLETNLNVLRERGVLVEFDLMIQNPESSLISYLLSNPRRVIVHFSSTEHLNRCFAILHGYQLDYPKFEYGLAVTVNDDFEEYQKMLKRVHFVQVMGIETIGIQGQPFTDKIFDIIQRIHTIDSELPIQVDGGVSGDILVRLAESGASSVVVGSALFGAADPVAARVELQSIV